MGDVPDEGSLVSRDLSGKVREESWNHDSSVASPGNPRHWLHSRLENNSASKSA